VVERGVGPSETLARYTTNPCRVRVVDSVGGVDGHPGPGLEGGAPGRARRTSRPSRAAPTAPCRRRRPPWGARVGEVDHVDAAHLPRVDQEVLAHAHDVHPHVRRAVAPGSGPRSPTWNSLRNARSPRRRRTSGRSCGSPPGARASLPSRSSAGTRRLRRWREGLVAPVHHAAVVVEDGGVEEVDRPWDVAGAAGTDLVVTDQDGMGRVRNPVLVDPPYLPLLGACACRQAQFDVHADVMARPRATPRRCCNWTRTARPRTSG
jgi:hypothetical protein